MPLVPLLATKELHIDTTNRHHILNVWAYNHHVVPGHGDGDGDEAAEGAQQRVADPRCVFFILRSGAVF